VSKKNRNAGFAAGKALGLAYSRAEAAEQETEALKAKVAALSAAPVPPPASPPAPPAPPADPLVLMSQSDPNPVNRALARAAVALRKPTWGQP
jgi:hypothetical protein